MNRLLSQGDVRQGKERLETAQNFDDGLHGMDTDLGEVSATDS